MTTKEEATDILGTLTDREIDEWVEHLLNPQGYQQTHGGWLDTDVTPVGMCCLTVFATQVGHIEIDEDCGNLLHARDETEDEDDDEHEHWSDVAERIFANRWRLDTVPFIARNDKITEDDAPGYPEPEELVASDGELREWTFEEIAGYLRELKEARSS
jgi:hypothetical protein